MSLSNVIIIVPAFNAGKEFPCVLEKLSPYKNNTIIVDDGSNDTTPEILEGSEFEYIRHEKNIGMGGAIKTGIKYALNRRYTHAICLDADGQHDPRFIELFKKELNNFDFVIGSRFHADTIKSIPSSKLSSNFLGATIVKATLGIKIKDTSCGFRGFKLSQSHLNIVENGYGFVFKQLFEMLNVKTKIATVDMPATYPQNSLMCTRAEEIAGFCNALLEYVNQKVIKRKITRLINSTIRKRDFHFIIFNMNFYGFYLERNNSYIIQSEQPYAFEFFSTS